MIRPTAIELNGLRVGGNADGLVVDYVYPGTIDIHITEGITLKTAYEHTSFDGLLSFVMQGGCIGMVGGYVPLLTPVGDRLRVLELPNFSLRCRVMALHPARLDPLTAEFLEFFREFFGAAPLPVASDSSNDGTENL